MWTPRWQPGPAAGGGASMWWRQQQQQPPSSAAAQSQHQPHPGPFPGASANTTVGPALVLPTTSVFGLVARRPFFQLQQLGPLTLAAAGSSDVPAVPAPIGTGDVVPSSNTTYQALPTGAAERHDGHDRHVRHDSHERTEKQMEPSMSKQTGAASSAGGAGSPTSAELYALCRSNQLHLESTTQQLRDLQSQMQSLQSTLALIASKLAVTSASAHTSGIVASDAGGRREPSPPVDIQKSSGTTPSESKATSSSATTSPSMRDSDAETSLGGSPFLVIDPNAIYFSHTPPNITAQPPTAKNPSINPLRN